MNKTFSLKEWSNSRILFPVTVVLCIMLCLAAAVMLILARRDQAVAVVNGEKIFKEELYQTMFEQGGRDALEQMVTVMLIEQEGKKRGVSVSSDEIEAEVDQFVAENFDGDRDSFQHTLEQYEIKLDTFKRNVRIDLTVRKMAAADLDLSDTEVELFFETNRDRYDLPEEIEARHILVETEAEAQEVLALLQNGADFAALAEERSQDTASAAEGGRLGFFPRGRMAAAFEEAAFALEKGELSAPVETGHGFHVIELLERKPGRAVSLDEVKEDVLADMNEAQLPQLIQQLVASLRENATISYD